MNVFVFPARAAAVAMFTCGALALVGCTTTPPDVPAGQASSAKDADTRLDVDVQTALSRLYRTVPGARNMVARAAGVLVFPRVLGGSFIIGAQHGKGVLLVRGRNAGYYSTTGASVGWQVGAQSKAVLYVFNSQEALRKFQNTHGWTVGADATVAVGHVGANGSIDSQTLDRPVTSFVMNNAGVEGGVSLDGAKISRVAP